MSIDGPGMHGRFATIRITYPTRVLYRDMILHAYVYQGPDKHWKKKSKVPGIRSNIILIALIPPV